MDLHLENDASSWLVSYNNYLRDVVGTAVTTRVRYSRVVRHFIGTCLEGDTGWAKLSVQRITEFVREETASKKGELGWWCPAKPLKVQHRPPYTVEGHK